jgi:hypothetical protein
LANLSSQGGAAISSVARVAAEQNPIYKKYKKEIDAEMDKFRQFNPGVIVTPEHYSAATEIVRGRHVEEEVNERIEEQRRQQREQEDALLPENQHVEAKPEKEPTTLKEALDVPDWSLFNEKTQAVGGRTPEEELRKMGFRGGLPDFLNTRKQMKATQDEVGSGMGLDRDWVWTDKAKGEGHYVN